jgi:2-polyprenyl-3-methyl-5-hydroxy-6-metoxy-1,4-benzoquinol methylase
LDAQQTVLRNQDTTWPAWVCTTHQTPLHQGTDAFTCPAGERWPIVEGIPRFVSSDNYAAAFGLQWLRYRQTQLDSYTGVPITERRMQRCLGPELWNTLAGTHVLECGCGAGRFTEVLLNKGARVTSIDLSTAVEANQINCPQDERHRIAQADITSLPFMPQQFDIVLCLGVIQHTPSPELTIQRLFEQVKPGGWLVIDHYTYSLSILTKATFPLRFVLKRMDPDSALRATELIVSTLLPLHRAVRRSKVLQRMLSRVSPVYCYYQSIPELSDQLQQEWALLDTHDALTDWYKWLRTRGQIRRALEACGATEIWCEYGGNGVEARARRPSP